MIFFAVNKTLPPQTDIPCFVVLEYNNLQGTISTQFWDNVYKQRQMLPKTPSEYLNILKQREMMMMVMRITHQQELTFGFQNVLVK